MNKHPGYWDGFWDWFDRNAVVCVLLLLTATLCGVVKDGCDGKDKMKQFEERIERLEAPK